MVVALCSLHCSNWLKNLPWSKEKTTRLQQEYDKQLLPILLKRLSEMGVNVSEQEQQQLLSGAYSRSSSPAGGKCPFPGVHSSPSSSSSSSGNSSSAQCPMASAAATEAAIQDSTDILSLAVKLSQQQGAEAGTESGVDLEVLMSQMKTFFAAGRPLLLLYVLVVLAVSHVLQCCIFAKQLF